MGVVQDGGHVQKNVVLKRGEIREKSEWPVMSLVTMSSYSGLCVADGVAAEISQRVRFSDDL